jgi:small subunit ribosomal protein S21
LGARHSIKYSGQNTCTSNNNFNTFAALKIKILHMLIINVKEEESIDRALKRYKRKVNSTKIIKELRNRKNFTKPSVQRRNEILSAAYRTKKFGSI